MRTDRHQRIGCKLGNLVPAHAQILAERRDVDVIAGGNIAMIVRNSVSVGRLRSHQ